MCVGKAGPEVASYVREIFPFQIRSSQVVVVALTSLRIMKTEP